MGAPQEHFPGQVPGTPPLGLGVPDSSPGCGYARPILNVLLASAPLWRVRPAFQMRHSFIVEKLSSGSPPFMKPNGISSLLNHFP